MARILVTGAAGFIGSQLVREAVKQGYDVTILDLLTYAGHMASLEGVDAKFEKGDIGDQALVGEILRRDKISAVVNLAAESHVDNSIDGPLPFIQTNIVGTFKLLEACRKYHGETKSADFRYVQVSTDEVFGDLTDDEPAFTEETPYAPSSPYSASKASSDHVVHAWHKTYKLPALITNCSNNYGPRQLPEKLIPRMIVCALKNEPLPVYGKGLNVRDWIHVEDHARGVLLALKKGQPGQSYCFGGRSERKNIDVVKAICSTLDRLKPRAGGKKYDELISYVTDRAGHDWRYAIDDSKAEKELGFKREYKNFEAGIEQTVKWYLDNDKWLTAVTKARGTSTTLASFSKGPK
jgi:dTDP-glucose 4,6-dehydratase